ncbi:hypothetical protein CsatA_015129 [Cannabis sativa]
MANQIKKRLSTFSFASFCIRRAQNVPRQPNSFDCGVFVALYMIHRCRLDKRSFEFNSNEERCHLAQWIVCSNYNKYRSKMMKNVV